MHYSDYLQLDKVLNAQQPEGERQGQPAHDEMLFIVIHQAIRALVSPIVIWTPESINNILQQPAPQRQFSPELQTIVHRLARCGSTVLKITGSADRYHGDDDPHGFPDFRDKAAPRLKAFKAGSLNHLPEARRRLEIWSTGTASNALFIPAPPQPEIDIIQAGEKEPSLSPTAE